MPIELYPNIAKVKRNGVYQNLPGFVQASSDTDIKAMIANSEISTTAQYDHSEGAYFILNDILYKAIIDIAVNDTIAVGTNCEVAILGNDVASQSQEIDDLNTSIMDIGVMSNPINKFLGTWSTDGYISGGSFIALANYKTTKPIPLKAGNYLFNIYYASYGSSAQDVWVCNEDGSFISRIRGTKLDDLDYTNRKSIISFTLPTDSYVRTNVGTNADDIGSYMLVVGNASADFPDHYIPHEDSVFKLNDDIKLSEAMETQVSGMINSAGKLYNKKISADGDSICYGNGYLGGYAKMISDKFSMTYQNIAVGGGTIVSGTYVDSTPRHWICRSVENLDTDADYILVEGGCNDASLNVTLGEITTGLSSTLDDTTFYGAMETICKILTTKYVGKKYAFIIAHGCTNGYYSGGDYYNAIVACCRKWGVPLIDLTKYVPPFNMFRGADYDAIRALYTTSGDGWHPTELCYEEYYVPIIESFMEKL